MAEYVVDANSLGNEFKLRPGAWVFETLWKLAGDDCSVQLNVPDTVILYNGVPRKWLATQHQILVQRSLPLSPSDMSGGALQDITAEKQAAHLAECFAAIRAGFASFLKSLGTNLAISAPFCLVWFQDGRQEILKLGDFDRLKKEVMWTSEVAALQPYAEAQSTHIGLFRRERVRNGFDKTTQTVMGDWKDGNLIDVQALLGSSDMHSEIASRRPGPEEVNVALDGVTDRLAHALSSAYLFPGADLEAVATWVVDGGFSIASPEDAGSTYSARSTESGLCVTDPPTCKQRVISLTAHFYTSLDSRLWLSHVSSVYTMPQRQPQIVQLSQQGEGSERDIMRMAAQEAVFAADEAEVDLRELVVQGLAHNLDFGQQFSHFDVTTEGQIDQTQFSNGMQELGIELPPAPLMVLWDRFVKNDTGHVTLEGFVAFFESGASAGTGGGTALNRLEYSRQSASELAKQSKLSEFLPDAMHLEAVSDQQATSSSDNEDAVFESSRYGTAEQMRKNASRRKAKGRVRHFGGGTWEGEEQGNLLDATAAEQQIFDVALQNLEEMDKEEFLKDRGKIDPKAKAEAARIHRRKLKEIKQRGMKLKKEHSEALNGVLRFRPKPRLGSESKALDLRRPGSGRGMKELYGGSLDQSMINRQLDIQSLPLPGADGDSGDSSWEDDVALDSDALQQTQRKRFQSVTMKMKLARTRAQRIRLAAAEADRRSKGPDAAYNAAVTTGGGGGLRAIQKLRTSKHQPKSAPREYIRPKSIVESYIGNLETHGFNRISTEWMSALSSVDGELRTPSIGSAFFDLPGVPEDLRSSLSTASGNSLFSAGQTGLWTSPHELGIGRASVFSHPQIWEPATRPDVTSTGLFPQFVPHQTLNATAAAPKSSSGSASPSRKKRNVPFERFWFDENTSLVYTVLKGPPVRPGQTNLPYKTGRPVDLLYVPDLFEDISGLRSRFQSLISALPGSRLLFVHYPGLAGTTWSEHPHEQQEQLDQTLSSIETKQTIIKDSLGNSMRRSKALSGKLQSSGTKQSQAATQSAVEESTYAMLGKRRWLSPRRLAITIAACLTHTRLRGEWGPSSPQDIIGRKKARKDNAIGRDCVLIGSGFGAHITGVLAAEILGRRSTTKGNKSLAKQDRVIASAVRAVVLVNGFAKVDSELGLVLERLSLTHGPLAALAGVMDANRAEDAPLGSFTAGAPRAAKRPEHIAPRGAPGTATCTVLAESGADLASTAALTQVMDTTFQQTSAKETFQLDGKSIAANITMTKADRALRNSIGVKFRRGLYNDQSERAKGRGWSKMTAISKSISMSRSLASSVSTTDKQNPAGVVESMEEVEALQSVRKDVLRLHQAILFSSQYKQEIGSIFALAELWELNWSLGNADPFLDYGIARLGEAAYRHSTDTSDSLSSCPFPILLIAGTENSFVLPQHSVDIRDRRRKAEARARGQDQEDWPTFDPIADWNTFLVDCSRPLHPKIQANFVDVPSDMGLADFEALCKSVAEDVGEEDTIADAAAADEAELLKTIPRHKRLPTERLRNGRIVRTEDSVSDSAILGARPTFSAFLQGGHCLLQERADDLLQLFEKIICGHAGGITSHEGFGILPHDMTVQDADILPPDPAVASPPPKSLNAVHLKHEKHSPVAQVVRSKPQDVSLQQAKIQEQLSQRGIDLQGTELEMLAILSEVMDNEDAQNRRKAALAVPKEKRKLIETKRRLARLKAMYKAKQRQAAKRGKQINIDEAKAIVDRELQEDAQRGVDKILMKREDDRAQQLREHINELAQHSIEDAAIRAKLEELRRGQVSRPVESASAVTETVEASARASAMQAVKSRMDKTQTRAQRAQEAALSLKVTLLGESVGGYFLDSESVQELSVGSHRLLQDASTLRSRKKAALRRWRRLDNRIKIIESELSKIKADLILNQRATAAARKERDALRRALSKHGQLQDKSSSIVKTLEDEIFEMDVRRDAKKKTQQTLLEQLEVSIVEMDQIGSSAHALVAKAKHVEDTLVQLRLAISQKVSLTRDSRANYLKRKETNLKRAREASSNVGRLKRKLKELIAELKRTQAASGKYVDTYFFHPGYSQRIEAAVLRQQLRAEIKKVKLERLECKNAVASATQVSTSADANAVAAAEDISVLGRILAQVIDSISSAPPYADDLKSELALDEKDEAKADEKLRDVAEAVGVDSSRLQGMPRREQNLIWRAAQLNTMRELNIFCEAVVRSEDSASLSELGAEFASPSIPHAFLDMPEVVRVLQMVLGSSDKLREDSKLRLITRWKAADERTAEERRWVALDRKMLPLLYDKANANDTKIMEADILYKSPWPAEILQEVSSLPCSPATAISAMSSPQHLEIHRLIAKYTHGHGEETERIRDMALGAKSVACAAVARGFAARTKAPSMRTAEEQDWVSLDRIYRPHLYIDPNNLGSMDSSITESIRSQPQTAVSRRGRRATEHEDLESSLQGLSTEESVIVEAVNGSLSDSELMSGASVRHRLLTAKRLKDSIMFEASIEEQRAAGHGERPEWEAGLGPSPRFNPALETDLFTEPLSQRRGQSRSELTPRDAKSMFYRLMQHKFRRERRKKADLANTKHQKKLQWLKRQAAIQAKQLETAEAQILGGVAIGDIRRRAHFARPPPGDLSQFYDRQQLHSILWTRPADLTSARDRRVQMLLRAYGSDGGYALARLVSSHSTPVVYGIPEIADAQNLLAEELREAGEISVLDELAYADADGSRENIAAVAVGSAQGCVLVRSAKSLVLLDVQNASLQPGSTQEHVFEVPGSLSDVLAFGPRGWDGVPSAVAKLMEPAEIPADVIGRPGNITRGHMLSAEMRGSTRIGGGIDSLQNEFRPPSSTSFHQALQGELPTHRNQAPGSFMDSHSIEPVDPLTAAQQFNQRLATAEIHTALPAHPLERVAFETAGGMSTTHLLGQDGPMQLPYTVRYEHQPAVKSITQRALHSANLTSVGPYTAAGSDFAVHTAWTPAAAVNGANDMHAIDMVKGAHSNKASAGRSIVASSVGGMPKGIDIEPSAPAGLGPVTWTELGAEPLHHEIRRELAGGEDPAEAFKREIRKQKIREDAERAAQASGKRDESAVSDEGETLVTDFEKETGCPGVRPMVSDLTAVITFHGAFSGKSAAYVLAKLQAALYREAFSKLDDVPNNYHQEEGVIASEDPNDFLSVSRSASAAAAQGGLVFSTETPRTDRTVQGVQTDQSRQASRGINTRGPAAYSVPPTALGQNVRPSARPVATPRDSAAAGAISRGELSVRSDADAWVVSKPGNATQTSLGRLESGALFATHGKIPFVSRDPFTVKAWGDADGESAGSLEIANFVGHPFVPMSQTEQYHLSNPNMAPTRPGTPEQQHYKPLEDAALEARLSLQESLTTAFSSTVEPRKSQRDTASKAHVKRAGGYYGPAVDVYGVEQLGPDADKRAPTHLSQSQLPPLARNLPVVDGISADQIVACMRWPVGYSVAAECNPNTPTSIGKITIRHEPMYAPVQPGRYAVCIQGLTPGSYSVAVNASVVFSARDVLEGAVRRVASTSARLPECRQELNDISQSFRLGQRKMHLVRDLVVKTEQELSVMSQRTAALRRALERGLVTRGDLGSDAEDEGLNFEEQLEIIGAGDNAGDYSSGFSSSATEENLDSSDASSTESAQESSEESASESDSDLSYSGGISSGSGSVISGSDAESAGGKREGDDSSVSSQESVGLESASGNQGNDANKLIRRQKKRGAKFAAGKAAAAALKQKGRARRAGADRAKLKQMREQLPVSEHVRQLVLRQLTKLDDRFSQFVRLLNLREDELVQIEDGLQALHQASMTRQQEMSQLMQRLREYKKHLPIALDAMKMKLGDPLPTDEGKQARISLSTKLGFGKGAQVPGQQEVDEEMGRAYTGINFSSATASEIEYEQGMMDEGRVNPAADGETDGQKSDSTGYKLVPCSEHDQNVLLYGPEIVKFMIDARKSVSDQSVLTPAQFIRRKPLHELTKEEKRWMSMDIVLNPELYADKMDDDSGDELEALMENGVIVQQSGQQREKKKLKLPPRSPAIGAAMGVSDSVALQAPGSSAKCRVSEAARETYLHKETVTSPYTAGAMTAPAADIDSDAPVAAEDIADMADFDVQEPSTKSSAHQTASTRQQAAKSAVFFALNKLQRNLPKCSLTRLELVRVLTVPFQQLNKKERETRKLLGKYHDNPSRVRANAEAAGDGTIGKQPLQHEHKSTLQQLYSMQQEEEDSGSDNEVERGKKFVPQQAQLGSLKVHASSSAFMRAYAAVPIPQGVAQPLRLLLQKRTQELNSRWLIHMAKTLKGHDKSENLGAKTLQDIRQDRFASTASAVGGNKPSTVLEMVECVRGRQDPTKAIALHRVVDFSQTQRDTTQLDVDEICRDLLEELDRSLATDAPFMESSVLHGTEQRYETKVLVGELEEHLNRLLLAQVFERESIEAALIEEQQDMYRRAAANEANEQEKSIAADRQKAMQRLESMEAKRAEAALAELKSFDSTIDLTDDEIRERAELAAAAAALVQQREELKAKMQEKEMDFGDGDSSVSSLSMRSDVAAPGDYDLGATDPLLEIGALAKWGDPNKPITPRRAEQQKIQALIAREKARAAARNMAKGTAGSGSGVNAVQRRRKAELLNLLQEGVLVADDDPDGVDFGVEGVKVRDTASNRLPPWKPSVPVESLKARVAVLNRELLRVRTETSATVESDVMLSFLRGGNKTATRIDAIFELGLEIAEIKNSLRLNDLDKELHRGFSSTKEWMTTSVLHGTPQQVWRLNAIEALERQANRIVARQTVVGLIEDVLQWMLEGWHFGERQSYLAAQGFVPSLKQEGVLRPSEGAAKAAVQFTQEGPAATAMAMDAARGLLPAPEESPFDANIMAAEDMIERDPRGDRFPFAHAAVQQDRAEQQMQLFLQQQLPLQSIPEATEQEIWEQGLGEYTGSGVEVHQEPATPAASMDRVLPKIGPAHRPSSMALQPSVRESTMTAGASELGASSVAAAPPRAIHNQHAPSVMQHATLSGGVIGPGRTQDTLDKLGVQVQNPFVSAPPQPDTVESAHVQMIKSGAQLVHKRARDEEADAAVPAIFKAMVADETSKGAHGVVGGDARMPVDERWKNIHEAVAVRNAIRIAVKAYKKVDKTMDETEQTLKYGIFCMTLLYFRNMSQVKEQQQILSGARDVAILEAGAGDVKTADADLTKERLKMRNSSKRHIARAQALAALQQIASAGYERKAVRDRNRRFKEHMAHVERERKMTRRRLSSVLIQRIYRGHCGRIYVASIRAERMEAIEQAKREQAASVVLQAWYRGHLARQYVQTMRTEMAAFMAFLRREEDKELETVYYMDNVFERYKNQIKDVYQSRVKKRREMARKMQRNLEAEVVELDEGAVMDEMALAEAQEAAKDKEADPLENVNAKTLRGIGGDKTFFKLVTAEDLEKQTKARVKRENKAHADAKRQLRERAAASQSAKAAAALAAGQAASS